MRSRSTGRVPGEQKRESKIYWNKHKINVFNQYVTYYRTAWIAIIWNIQHKTGTWDLLCVKTENKNELYLLIHVGKEFLAKEVQSQSVGRSVDIFNLSTDVTVWFLSNGHQAKHAVKPSVCRQHTEEQIPTQEENTHILFFETVWYVDNQAS